MRSIRDITQISTTADCEQDERPSALGEVSEEEQRVVQSVRRREAILVTKEVEDRKVILAQRAM